MTAPRRTIEKSKIIVGDFNNMFSILRAGKKSLLTWAILTIKLTNIVLLIRLYIGPKNDRALIFFSSVCGTYEK